MSLLIHNVLIFANGDQNSILDGHAVAIEGTRIKEIGGESELNQSTKSATRNPFEIQHQRHRNCKANLANWSTDDYIK